MMSLAMMPAFKDSPPRRVRERNTERYSLIDETVLALDHQACRLSRRFRGVQVERRFGGGNPAGRVADQIGKRQRSGAEADDCS